MALAKGHLPAWSTLAVSDNEEAIIATKALRTGHLTRVKALEIELNSYGDEPAGLRSLLEAFKAHEGKLEALELEVPETNDLDTRDIMHARVPFLVCVLESP